MGIMRSLAKGLDKASGKVINFCGRHCIFSNRSNSSEALEILIAGSISGLIQPRYLAHVWTKLLNKLQDSARLSCLEDFKIGLVSVFDHKSEKLVQLWASSV